MQTLEEKAFNFSLAAILLASLILSSAGCGDGAETDGYTAADDGAGAVEAEARAERLAEVERWFYYLSFDPEDDTFSRIADSAYDMVVMEPVFTETENTGFDTAAIVQNLQGAAHAKLVIAYVDIGQAEEWRTYWEPDWEVGDPDWIVAEDPDGWEGNYPVAFWRDDWKDIWLDDNGYLQLLIDAGFDGVYLDWVEAYSDEDVVAASAEDGVDPEAEMVDFVGEIAAFGREQDERFIVIVQNAVELTSEPDYLNTVDAVAQEQVWFDGGADNDPPGDCPLPRTESDVGSAEYITSLSPECRRTYEEFPGSTLHVSSESFLEYLEAARDAGKPVFTVDYAIEQGNIAWVYRTSRAYGFVPFVGERSLAQYVDPYDG